MMRYEDMKHTPLETFTRAATFKERPPNTERFFRKGVAGDWQQTLTPMQIDKIVSCHHAMMQRFGYLDAAGNPQVM